MKRTASILEIARRSSANSSCLDRDYSLDSIASRSTASNVSRTSSQVVWSFTIHNRRTNCLLTMVDDRHACSPQNTRASTVRFRLGRASSPTPTGLARKPPRGGLPDSYRIAPRLVGSHRIAHSLSAWNPAARSGACRADDDPSSRTRRTHSSSRSNHQAPSLRKPRARLPHSVNVPKRTFTPFGLLRLQNPQQRPANGASSNEQPSEPTRIVDVERQKYLTPNRGVGALIQRGGRAVAGMLTIATAGGS